MSPQQPDGALDGIAGRPFRSSPTKSNETVPLHDLSATTPFRTDEFASVRAPESPAEPASPFADVPAIDAETVNSTKAYDTLAYGAAPFAPEPMTPPAESAPNAPAPQPGPSSVYAPQFDAVGQQPVPPQQPLPQGHVAAPAPGPQPVYPPAPPQGPGPYIPAPSAGGMPPYPAQPYAGAPASTTNEMGMWSLICAAIAVVGNFLPVVNWFSWLAPFVGVVLGIVGLTGQWAQRGKGLAIAGLITNAALIIIVPLLAVLFFGAFFVAFIPLIASSVG